MQQLTGHYHKFLKRQYDEREIYDLYLNSDSTFTFSIKTSHGNPKCKGVWVLSNDQIVLQCSEPEDPSEEITSGYLSTRNFAFKVATRRKLLFNNIPLKRVK